LTESAHEREMQIKIRPKKNQTSSKTKKRKFALMQTRRNHETEAAEIFIKARTGTRGKTIKKRKILQKRRGIVVIRILLNLQNIFY